VPAGWIVGATGSEGEQRDNGDGAATHRDYQEDVHAVTWTTSRDYIDLAERFFEPGLPPVEMRLLIQPEHLAQAQRHFDATRETLKHYGLWYGAYPYDHVTVIDPAWGSGAGGMEYPTLFTSGTRLFNPFGGGSPEGVTVHEMGHQFWYGLVGNNEFEHAWLDEGLNTVSTNRTMQEVWGDRFLVQRYLPPPGKESRSGFIPVTFRDIRTNAFVNRLDRLRPHLTSNEPHEPTYRYHPATGYNITYSKTALWLLTLENHLGWNTLQRILSTFFERYRFQHPTPDDFFAVADEVAGQPLGWFFDQVYFDSVVFDYAIGSVASTPSEAEGFVERGGELVYVQPDEEPGDDAMYRTEIGVKRLGGGRFPVEVLLVFEDGHEVRHEWDGRERWKLLVEERRSKLRYAAVDPERKLMLDPNYTNNSKLLESRAGLPARKWASKWMIMLQDMLDTFAFYM
jgi:hypothetical protein